MELISEIVCPALLVVGASRDHSPNLGLVREPAVVHQVEGRVTRFDPERTGSFPKVVLRFLKPSFDGSQFDPSGGMRTFVGRFGADRHSETDTLAGFQHKCRTERGDRIVPSARALRSNHFGEGSRTVHTPLPPEPVGFIGEPFDSFETGDGNVRRHGRAERNSRAVVQTGPLPSEEGVSLGLDRDEQPVELAMPIGMVSQMKVEKGTDEQGSGPVGGVAYLDDPMLASALHGHKNGSVKTLFPKKLRSKTV